MNREDLKKNIKRLLMLLIATFIIYSIYIHLEYRQYIHQSLDRNYHYLSIISASGNNLANRLEEFIHLPFEEETNEEVKSELYDNWRIINGESRSIHSYLVAVSTTHAKDNEATNWDLLRYSLYRIDSFIYGMTNTFLEHHTYVVGSEEKEKMEAVISVYRAIREETENESADLEIILQSIKESMLVIDEHYSDTLERAGR